MLKLRYALSFSFLLTSLLTAHFAFAAEPKTEASVKIDGIDFNIVMQAPHLTKTKLQVFGTFLYQDKNDGFSGADVEMDEGFKGVIQEERKTYHFGKLAEHLVLTPPAGGIVIPQHILMMGLGDPATFKAEDMQQVGTSEIRIVCSMGLTEYMHASDVQDGGVTRVNAGVIAENVIKGIVQELRNQRELAKKGAVEACAVKKITYLAGPKFVKDTIASLKKVAQELNATSAK